MILKLGVFAIHQAYIKVCMYDPETLGETYVYSFSWNKNEDLGRADIWAAHNVLPNDSILSLIVKSWFFNIQF